MLWLYPLTVKWSALRVLAGKSHVQVVLASIKIHPQNIAKYYWIWKYFLQFWLAVYDSKDSVINEQASLY